MRAARATVHGAVSLVNAVATGRGATLGVALRVSATAAWSGRPGVRLLRGSGPPASARLVEATARRSAPEGRRGGRGIDVRVESEVPAGYGLKSSSATSSAVALACRRLCGAGGGVRAAILDGARASLEAGVSITGAYDDACACCHGGFCVTDNRRMRTEASARAPPGLAVLIHVPARRRRRSPRGLAGARAALGEAWEAARRGDYWSAMALNGAAAAPALGSDPALPGRLVGAGALAASVSGNGPAVAAVCRARDAARVRAAMAAAGPGRVVRTRPSNAGASVRDL